MATCPKCRAHYADNLKHCEVDGELLLPDAAVAGFDGELHEGELVGEYVIEKKIGEGGFGKVYSAVHPIIGKRAAIKVLNREFSSNAMVVSRFVSEARAVNQIRHRNIIDIFSFGSLPGGLQYLVMELLDGETLDAYLEKNERIPAEQALPILHRIAKALDAAHAAGIAHRDLKPENVFLCFDDEGGVFPKLLDFGIAKLMGNSNLNHKTRTGAAMGTPLYMSPEQCRGKGVDHRTDLYSFGVMIHEILTGQLPFDGDSMMDLMFKHAKEPPPPMSSVNPAVPPPLDAPVLHMMQKDPAMRPVSVTAGVEAMVDAARSVGMVIAIKKATTLGGIGGGQVRGIPSDMGTSTPAVPSTKAAAPTMPVGSTVAQMPANTNPSASHTLQTVETVAATSSSKTWIVAVAALVVGVGATFALTRSGEVDTSNRVHGAPENAASPTPSAEASDGEPQPASSQAPTSSAEPAAPPPSASATTATTATPPPAPPTPTPIGAQPRPRPTRPPTPPPTQPQRKQPPSDLESPF